MSFESAELRALVDATERCMEQCRSMLEFESEKRQLLLRSDFDRLEETLSAQQSAIMQLYNLENARVEAQRAAGLEGLNASEIAARIEDPEQRKALEDLLLEWRVMLDQLKVQNTAALDIARDDLRLFEALTGTGAATKDAGTYGKTGSKVSGYQNTFQEKI